MKKLLVTGSFPLNDAQRDTLSRLGFSVTFHPDEREKVEAPEQYEAVICNGLFLYNPLENFSSLRVIQLTSAGLDRVPLEQIRNRKIRLYSARGVYSVPMAEFALGGVLQLIKHSRFFMKNQMDHRWQKHRGLRELFGSRVCILGCGSVGTECAKRFRAFECTVTGVDLYPYESTDFHEILPLSELYLCLSQADVVLLTLPLTEQTYHLMDSAAFSSMKEGAIFVNIARGAVVESQALLQALDSGLGGAVLDVFEEEPLEEESPLWDRENVILTPHNSFVSDGNNGRLWELICRNLRENMGELQGDML